MATNPAVAADVQSRFPRPLTTVEETMATTLLDDAWSDLQAAVPDLAARIDDNEDGLTVKTRRVLAQSVKRVLLNPFGRKRESRGLDDAQRSWTLDDGLASGEIYFTDDELDSLRSGEEDPDQMRGKAFSVMPS